MDRGEAIHLVRRTGFGLDWAFVDQLTGLSRTDAVNLVTDFAPNPAPVAPPGTFDEGGTRWRQINNLQIWWMERMRTVPRPLAEKLALFFHGHFATSARSAKFAHQLWTENNVLRSYLTGSFRDLAQAVAVGPMMLLYLDNHRNKAGKVNENFGRELLELHLLGPAGHHSEADVVATTRAWTGHNLDDGQRAYQYWPSRHDDGNKTIFGITRNWNGPEVIDEVVHGIHRVNSARYLAAKLWSSLAFPDPPSHVIDGIVGSYLASNLNILSLVRAILNHDDFYGAASRQGLLRSPVEWAVACARGTNSPMSQVRADWWVDDMGQNLFYPPNPAGWGGNAAWLSPTGAWARADYARHLGWKTLEHDRVPEVSKMSVHSAVDHHLGIFGLTEVSTQTRVALENYLHAERATKIWPQAINLLTLVMLAPEMQLA